MLPVNLDTCKGFVADAVVVLGALLFAAIFLGILGDVAKSGLPGISWEFLTERPSRAGRAGGIGPILVSTALVVGIAVLVATPMAVATAVLLTDYMSPDTWAVGAIRQCLFVLSSVPSIVFGLVGNALFCDLMGMGFSILSGGLTLALMILPLMAAVLEQVFRSIPGHMRLTGHAIGMPKRRILLRILLPQAFPGILAAASLGIGRALAESAALVFTSGYVDRMPSSVMDSGRVMAVHILDLAMNITGGLARASSTALVLLSVMAILMGALTLGEFYLRRKSGVH